MQEDEQHKLAVINISLPVKLRSWVKERVSGSGYGTISEYIRELIRKDLVEISDRNIGEDWSQETPGYFSASKTRLRKLNSMDINWQNIGKETVLERLLQGLELVEFGFELTKERIRRESRSKNHQQIQKKFLAWVHHHPGAESGDGVGRIIPKKRLRRLMRGEP